MPSKETEPSTVVQPLESWLQRYAGVGDMKKVTTENSEFNGERGAATDTWSGAPVELWRWTRRGAQPLTPDCVQTFVERAKILRHNDHAHIQPVLDFFIEDQAINWVCPPCAKPFLIDASSFDIKAAAQLCQQYISIVNYFATHANNGIPRGLPGFLHAQGETLMVCGFQSEYFFGHSDLDLNKSVSQFILAAVARTSGPESFLEQLRGLANARMSLSKLKTALKHLEDETCLISEN